MVDSHSSFTDRTSSLLAYRLRRRRTQLVVACLALAVLFGMGLTLRQIGFARIHDVRELDCPVTGIVAHHHTAECYDDQGNLVCQLPVRDIHVHDDSCYEERTYLVCGQEESPEHHHTDACYRTEKVLTCGLEECSTTHQHSDACFRTVSVDDENGSRCQVLTSEIKEKDDKGVERVALTMRADVPEGVLPKDAVLKVERPGASENDAEKAQTQAKATTDAALAALTRELGDACAATLVESASIAYADSNNSEAIPACTVAYRMSSDAIAAVAPERLRLVVIDAKTGKATLLQSTNKIVVAEDGSLRSDATKQDVAASNTLGFSASGPCSVVAFDVDPTTVEPAVMPATTLTGVTASGVSVTADVPEGALPEGATMGLTDLTSAEASRLIAAAESREGRTAEVLSVTAVDFRFFDASGNPIESRLPMALHLSAPAIGSMSNPSPYLLPGDKPGEVASPMTSSVDASAATASFEATTSGSYAVADVAYTAGATLTAQGKGYKVIASYGADANIPEGATLQASEILESAKEHDALVSASLDALGIEGDAETAETSARAFDISIVSDGKKVQPAKGSFVDVRIELDDAQEGDFDVVHFADGSKKGDVVSDVATETPVEGVSDVQGRSVSFSAPSFSTYVIVQANPTSSVGKFEGGIFAFAVVAGDTVSQGNYRIGSLEGGVDVNAGKLYSKSYDYWNDLNGDLNNLTYWKIEKTVDVPNVLDCRYTMQIVYSGRYPQNVGKYLYFDDVLEGDNTPNHVGLSDFPQNLTIEPQGGDNVGNIFVWHVSDQHQGKRQKLDLSANSSENGFIGYWGNGSGSDQLRPIPYAGDLQIPYTFAIESVNNGRATLESSLSTGDGDLARGVAADQYYLDQAGANRTYWEYTPIGQVAGGMKCYLKAVGGANDGKYLTFQYDATLAVGRKYRLVMSDEPQPLRYLVRNGGNNFLIAHETENYAVDNFGDGRGFAVYQFGDDGNRLLRAVRVIDRDPLDLVGKSFVLVNEDLGQNRPIGILSSTAGPNDGGGRTTLQAMSATKQTDLLVDVHDKNGAAVDVTEWPFEPAGNGNYYVKDASGKYLNITKRPNDDGNASLAMSNNPQALRITLGGTGQHSHDQVGKICITSLPADTGGRAYSLNLAGLQYTNGYTAWADGPHWNDQSDWFSLYDATKLEQEFYATAVSVQELQPGKEYLVCMAIVDPSGNRRSVAIAGDGSLVDVIDRADEIRGRSDVSPFWTFTDLGGNYFDFQNTRGLIPGGGNQSYYESGTNKHLDPTNTGDILSDDAVGVTLDGRTRDNTYSSSITTWYDTLKKYYGLTIEDVDGVPTLVSREHTAESGIDFEWTFAEIKKKDTSKLQKIDTLDSASKGVTIKMYDFLAPGCPDLDYNDEISKYLSGSAYRDGHFYNNSGLASKTLDANGFPTFDIYDDGNGWSYNPNNPLRAYDLFNGTHYPGIVRNADNTYTFTGDPTPNYLGTANHLFALEPYEGYGFFSYSGFSNAAVWKGSTSQTNQNNVDFDVYEQLGSPGGGVKWMQRGNFFPYDKLDQDGNLIPNDIVNYNLYDKYGNPLPDTNPSFSEPLYGYDTRAYPLDKNNTPVKANHWFGMTIDMRFLMPEGGINMGYPMMYDFTGDDDLWIYIDGVKVLDIGGIHDGLEGNINFMTGQITYGENSDGAKIVTIPEGGGAVQINGNEKKPWYELPTTIKQAFEQAGVFPDGSSWDDNKVDNYFNGETFKDFTAHDFRMIYVEHGGTCSNLDVLFNLPSVEPASFIVEKTLDEKMQSLYGNREFSYQVFVNDYDTPVTREDGNIYHGIYDDDLHNVRKAELLDADGTRLDDLQIENGTGIFKLKANQKARFKLEAQTMKYFVREVGMADDVKHVDEFGASASGSSTKLSQQDRPNFPWNGGWGTDTVPGANSIPPDINGALEVGKSTPIQQPIVRFTNEMDEAPLEIEKKIGVGMKVDNDYFRFRVWLENQDGTLTPVNKARYTLWNKVYDTADLTQFHWEKDQATHTTGPNGTLEIQADQKAVINGLLKGTRYVVIEDGMPMFGNENLYSFGGLDWRNNDFWAAGAWDVFKNAATSGWATYGGTAYDADRDGKHYHANGTTRSMLELAHERVPGALDPATVIDQHQDLTHIDATNNNQVMLYFRKADKTKTSGNTAIPDSTALLAGSHFKVEIGTPSKFKWTDDTIHDEPQFDDVTGDTISTVAEYAWAAAKDILEDVEILKDGNLAPARTGIYRVTELKAPVGYILPDPSTFYFTVDLNYHAVLCDQLGRTKTSTPPASMDLDKVAEFVKFETTTTQGGSKLLNMLVLDIPGTELPKSGGVGTTVFTLVGTLICASATVFYATTARKRQRE